MQEITLNGILHYFAIVSALVGNGRQMARDAVENYLTSYLGLTEHGDYIGLFDGFLDLYDGMEATEDVEEMDEVFLTNAGRLCEGLKPRLPRREQITVILRILQIVKYLDGETPVLRCLVNRSAEVFDLSAQMMAEMRRFIFTPEFGISSNAFLFIHAGDPGDEADPEVLVRPSWSMPVAVWRCAETDDYFLRASGPGIRLGTEAVEPEQFYLLTGDNAITDASGHSVSFRELTEASVRQREISVAMGAD